MGTLKLLFFLWVVFTILRQSIFGAGPDKRNVRRAPPNPDRRRQPRQSVPDAAEEADEVAEADNPRQLSPEEFMRWIENQQRGKLKPAAPAPAAVVAAVAEAEVPAARLVNASAAVAAEVARFSGDLAISKPMETTSVEQEVRRFEKEAQQDRESGRYSRHASDTPPQQMPVIEPRRYFDERPLLQQAFIWSEVFGKPKGLQLHPDNPFG